MKRSTMGALLLVVILLVAGRFALASEQEEVPGNNDTVTIPADQTLGDNTSVFHDGVRTRCDGEKRVTFAEGEELSSLVEEHVLLNPAPNMGTQAELVRAVEVVLQMNNLVTSDGIEPGTKLTLPEYCFAEQI